MNFRLKIFVVALAILSIMPSATIAALDKRDAAFFGVLGVALTGYFALLKGADQALKQQAERMQKENDDKMLEKDLHVNELLKQKEQAEKTLLQTLDAIPQKLKQQEKQIRQEYIDKHNEKMKKIILDSEKLAEETKQDLELLLKKTDLRKKTREEFLKENPEIEQQQNDYNQKRNKIQQEIASSSNPSDTATIAQHAKNLVSNTSLHEKQTQFRLTFFAEQVAACKKGEIFTKNECEELLKQIHHF